MKGSIGTPGSLTKLSKKEKLASKKGRIDRKKHRDKRDAARRRRDAEALIRKSTPGPLLIQKAGSDRPSAPGKACSEAQGEPVDVPWDE